ncbi:MAG TPA: hypothetical protein VF912_11255 [Anaeromyxobacter sp.]
MEELVLDDLTARLERVGPATLSLAFSGRSASRDPGKVLAPVFARALEAARTDGVVLALHFEGLEYFNSSTIAALLQFVRGAQEAGVPLEIVYDARQRWQALSFDALRRALRPLEAPGSGPTLRFLESQG